MRQFSNREIALEGWRSVVAQPVRTIGVALGCAVLGSGVALMTVWDVGGAEAAWNQQAYAGSHVFSVTSAAEGVEALISAERCADTAAIEGVKFAGGIVGTHEVRSSASPGLRYSLIEATPGYLDTAYPQDPSDELGRGTIAGSSISEALGLTGGSTLSYRVGSSLETRVLVVEDQAQGSALREPHDNVVMIAVPPRGYLGECLVAPRQGSAQALATVLEDWFAPGDVRVTVVLRANELVADPVQLLQTRVSQWVPIGLGVCLILFVVFGWWAQRASYAIYSALGASSMQMSALFVVETAVMCWVPVSIGFLVSLALSDALASRAIAEALIRDYSSLSAILITLPGMGAFVLRQRSAFDVAKGR